MFSKSNFENMLDQIHDLSMIRILVLANLRANVASDFLILDESSHGRPLKRGTLTQEAWCVQNHGQFAQASRRLCRVFDNTSSGNWTSK